jgi:hypothetical protein
MVSLGLSASQYRVVDVDMILKRRGYFTDIGCWELMKDPPNFLRGDADGDMDVDVDDATTILDYLFLGQWEVWCHDAMDVNDDATPDVEYDTGGVTIDDAVYLINFLYGGDLPKPPFPDEGLDPEGPTPGPLPDSYDCERYPSL